MIVVSDTSPLNYLVLIGHVDVLGTLFGRVLIPPTVLQELSDIGTPEVVRRWVAQLPGWIEIRTPTDVQRDPKLDPGEADAIALAEELHADALLIDEKRGRQAALQRGIAAYGTLAVLEAAAAKGLLDLPTVFGSLNSTNFRASRRLLDDALARDRSRKKKGS
jgi:predicted nucleic acid-binding protein